MKRAIDDGTLGRKPYHMDSSPDLQQTAKRGHPCYWDADQLYDLKTNPREQKNLAADPARAETSARIKQTLAAMLKPLGRSFGEFA